MDTRPSIPATRSEANANAISRLGVFAYAVPALSRSFLNGNPESERILDSIFAGPLGTVEIASFLLYTAGFFLFAIWRSGVLPGRGRCWRS